MTKFTRGGVALGAVAALAFGLAACGSDSSDEGSSAPSSSAAGDHKGGTLTVLDIPGNYEGTDPASIYYGHELASFRRLFYRSWVALPATDDPATAGVLVPDLATDTGTSPDGGLTWQFTLKDGVTWEDGTPITCEDFAYGLSRNFDETKVNGTGPGTAYVSILDLGGVEYPGPFTATPEQQAAFDSAVSCDGPTITYKFAQAFPDFPYSVASLFTTDPYREDLDASDSLWKVYSNGPYKIEGNTFDNEKGVVAVRNENYDPATDSEELRQANPDEFDFEFLENQEAIFDRLIADSGDDQYAFTTGNIPTGLYSQITGAVADRALESGSPYTRFLQINSKTLTDPKVRLALVTATPRAGALQILGGDHYGTVASTLVSEAIPGYQDNPSYASIPEDGDPAAAKALLEEAGAVGTTIKYSYPASNDINPKVAALFQEAWQAAGFTVELNGIAPDATPGYYGQMSDPDKDTDVFYSGWAADWASLLGVIPLVLETDNPGFNYGYYSNPDVDAAIAAGKEAAAAGDTDGLISNLQKADELAGADGAYVPLLKQKNWFLKGSKVGGFTPTVAASFYPDFGLIYAE